MAAAEAEVERQRAAAARRGGGEEQQISVLTVDVAQVFPSSLDLSLDPFTAFPASTSVASLRLRLAALQLFNAPLRIVLPLLDMQAGASEVEDVVSARRHRAATASATPPFDDGRACELASVSGALYAVRWAVFGEQKRLLWARAMTDSECGLEKPLVEVNRAVAAKFKDKENVSEEDISQTLFGQLHSCLCRTGARVPPQRLRRSDRAWKIIFRGEGSEDVGGPYHESISQVTTELQSPGGALPLLLRSPNAQHNIAAQRERFVLRPGRAPSPYTLQLHAFLGYLVGIALRTNNCLDLSLSPLVWLPLVGQRPRLQELALADAVAAHAVAALRNAHQQGIGREEFGDVFDLSFTTTDSAGGLVELLPAGANMPVTFDNREQFCALVEEFRVNESREQLRALHKGISEIVPARLLPLFTASELEVMVCGLPDLDVELLQRTTTYSQATGSEPHMRYFWEVLRQDLTPSERRAFLRFASGRSRLSMAGGEAALAEQYQHLDLRTMRTAGPPDLYLPSAQTCFFQVCIPTYSSRRVLCDKLRYAVQHCVAIDTDHLEMMPEASAFAE